MHELANLATKPEPRSNGTALGAIFCAQNPREPAPRGDWRSGWFIYTMLGVPFAVLASVQRVHFSRSSVSLPESTVRVHLPDTCYQPGHFLYCIRTYRSGYSGVVGRGHTSDNHPPTTIPPFPVDIVVFYARMAVVIGHAFGHSSLDQAVFQ